MTSGLEGALVRVGTEVAKKIYEIKLKEYIGHGSVDKVLQRKGGSLRDSRRARQQFEQMVDSIADHLQPWIEIEYRHLPANEIYAALMAVSDVFEGSRIDLDSLLKLDMDPFELERQIDTVATTVRQRALLSSDSEGIFRAVKRETCNYIVEIAISLPEYGNRAFQELLQRESSVLEIVREILRRLPQSQVASSSSEESEFELQYRRSLVRTLDHLELFGIDLSEASRRFALDVAYMSLSASSIPHGSQPEATVDKTTDAILEKPQSGEQEERIEEILARSNHIVIRGEAGSGETTLLQWLAVTAARKAFSRPVEGLNEKVPFFIRLRRFASKELPLPDQFMRASLPSMAATDSGAWTHEKLTSGDAILLIDGVDEVRSEDRRAVQEWLKSLSETFPNCVIVVTSRPAAVSAGWVDRIGFREAELMPMSRPDVFEFIDHWHSAVAQSVVTADEVREIDRLNEAIKNTLSANPNLGSLATSPLLCAMLCALNRDRRTKLPKDRMELYRIALEALLNRRNIERQVGDADIELTLPQKLILLRDLAFWYALDGRSDAARVDVVARLGEKMKHIREISADSEAVFQHLLTRSGIIREPVVDHVDFIHKTFQEYLAANEIVNQNLINMLVERSSSDQWQDIIVLGCGHASQPQRELLLTGLLDLGEKEPSQRHVLHLQAVACLETSEELEPTLRSRVLRTLQSLVPPKSLGEARVLASAGELAVQNLTSFESRKTSEVVPTVRTLALVGTESALELLRVYGADHRVTVQKELVRAWKNFDREAFTESIFTNPSIPLLAPVTLRDQASIDAVGKFEGLIREVQVQLAKKSPNLEPLAGSSIEDLYIDCGYLGDTSIFRRIEKLRRLVLLPDQLGPGTLEQLSSLPLISLSVWRANSADLSWLPVDSLYHLSFYEVGHVSNVDRLQAATNLRSLVLNRASVEQSSHLSSSPHLHHLMLTFCEFPAGVNLGGTCKTADLVEVNCGPTLTGLERVEMLTLENCTLNEAGFGDAKHLRALNVSGSNVALDDIPDTVETLVLQNLSTVAVSSLPSSLKRLCVLDCDELTSLTGLDNCVNLRYLAVAGCPNLATLGAVSTASPVTFVTDSITAPMGASSSHSLNSPRFRGLRYSLSAVHHSSTEYQFLTVLGVSRRELASKVF